MSNFLDVSLDSLIEAKVKSDRGGGRGAGRGDRRNSGGRGGSARPSSAKDSSMSRGSSRAIGTGQSSSRATNNRISAFTNFGHARREEQVSQLRQPFDNKGPPVRVSQNQGNERREKIQQAPMTIAPVASGSSIFDRLGNGSGSASGTSVTITKLNKDIGPKDISELCVTIGEVKSVNMRYDSNGKSTGQADVTFSKRSDAVSCVERFNNVSLDGTPMLVRLTGEPAAVAAGHDSASSTSSVPVWEAKTNNVREGLFGTAFGGEGNERKAQQEQPVRLNERKVPRDPSFSVTMRGAPSNSSQNQGQSRVQVPSKRRDEHDDRGDDAVPQSSNARITSSNRSSGGRDSNGGRGGGRGGRKGAGGGGGRGGRGPPVDEADLDSAMDTYMSNK